MKKVILCSFIAISILSCKKVENEKKSEIISETKKDSINVEKMSIAEIADTLKKGDYSKEFAKYSDEIINKIAENMTFTAAENGMSSGKESEFLKEITSIKNNIISLNWATCSTGGCMQSQKLQIKENNVMDLGNGFDKLTKSELEKIEKEIKSKYKNYSHISGRSESEINVNGNGNYLVKFSGLTEDDSEASGGSIEISYETKDLKTFIPTTLKITKLN